MRLSRAPRSPAWLAAMIAGVSVWLGGCYPGDSPLGDVTATLYDTAKDFSAYKTNATPSTATFSMADSVKDAGDPDDPGYQPVNHDYDAQLLGRIRSNLIARGWEEVTEAEALAGERADVGILVSALVTENTEIYASYPPYYGGWWGWGYYPPYGGWGYPCCTTVVQYTTGTILIDMVGLADGDPIAETYPIPWSARINGLVSTVNITSTRINTVIDQAFSQSPYLDVQ